MFGVVNDDGSTDPTELKEQQKKMYMETCKPPPGFESPKTAFEMLYICNCYGQRDCSIQI